MTVVQLRELARANKVRLPYGVNKAQMVETLFRQLGSGMKPAQAPAEQPDIGLYKPKPLGFYDEEYGTSNPVVPQMLKAGLLGSGHGLLEVQPGQGELDYPALLTALDALDPDLPVMTEHMTNEADSLRAEAYIRAHAERLGLAL